MATKNESTFLTAKKDKFIEFLDKIDDLTLISDIVKIKIDNDHILLYSVIGEKTIKAFKSYTLNTKDYFDVEEDIPYIIDFVINGAKKLLKKLYIYSGNQPVKFEYIHKEVDGILRQVRNCRISDSKLKVGIVGSDLSKIRNLDKNILKKQLDPSNAKGRFKINTKDLDDVRKLCNLHDDEVINIKSKNGLVTCYQQGWELEVDQSDSSFSDLVFAKKYLSCINCEEEFANFSIFPGFLLYAEGEKVVIIAYETDFSEED